MHGIKDAFVDGHRYISSGLIFPDVNDLIPSTRATSPHRVGDFQLHGVFHARNAWKWKDLSIPSSALQAWRYIRRLLLFCFFFFFFLP